jgi:hypothetical protein
VGYETGGKQVKKYLISIKKLGILIAIIISSLIIFQITYGGVAEPGSQEDPIITQSYLEEVVIPLIQEDFEGKIAALTKKVESLNQNSSQSGQGDKFIVVSVKAGQKLMGGAGTELILRMGKATIISSQLGGLADATQGTDLANGTPMPSNHLLIIPRDDGRGLVANEDVLVMVKGAYTIQ